MDMRSRLKSMAFKPEPAHVHDLKRLTRGGVKGE
jgi:hypothetical protein